MKLTLPLLWSALLAFLLLPAAGKPSVAAGPERQPVLLELFTSEGCSSCPPADQLLQALDQTQPVPGADLIVLSEHVDYWNHDGWADPYSSSAFSARQRDYADQLRVEDVYTPQLIVDGAAELVGSNAPKARAAIAAAILRIKIPISLTNAVREKERVTAQLEFDAPASLPKHAALYLALADNQDRSSVARGENAGRSLTHVAVLRLLLPLGTVKPGRLSRRVSVPLKSNAQNNLRLVVFLQDTASRHVLGVAQQKL